MVTHAYYLSIRRLRQEDIKWGQSGIHSKTLSQKQNWTKQIHIMGLVRFQRISFFHYVQGCVTICVISHHSHFSLFTVWEGGSVWDLPLDTTTPGPALEQLQQLEKAKAAKVWNSSFRGSTQLVATGHKCFCVLMSLSLASYTFSF
jgi:hypothetical protein